MKQANKDNLELSSHAGPSSVFQNHYLSSITAGLLVMIAMLICHQIVRQQHNQYVIEQTDGKCNLIKRTVAGVFEGAVVGLVQLSEIEEAGARQREARFLSARELGLMSVFYSEDGEVSDWVEVAGEFEIDDGVLLARYDESVSGLQIAEVEGQMYVLFHPVRRDGEVVGVLGGVVDIGEGLGSSPVRIIADSFEVLIEIRGDVGDGLDEVVSGEVLPVSVNVRPTEGYIAANQKQWVSMILYIGIVGALLVSFMVYFLQSRLFVSTVFESADTLLNEEIAEREHAVEVAKRANARLRDHKLALDHFAIVAETDAAGTITYVNEMFCEVSGYSAEEMIGQNHRMLNSGHHPKAFFVEMWRTIASGKPWRGEIKNRAKDGSYYWVDTSIFPFLDSEGKVEQYLAIRRVITDQKANEETIRRANEDLAQANDELERFVYTASHDLKSPIVTIRGFLGHLKNDAEKGRVERMVGFIDRVEAATMKMQHHIEDLLDLSRIGRVPQNPEEIDVTSLVESVVNDLDSQVKEKNVTVHIESEMPRIVADRGQMVQIFDNLIVNALKYGCTHESPEVWVGARALDGHIDYYVRDNGQGIAEDYQEKIFDLFQRLETSAEGTGIGLALVKRVVNLNQGSVWVESEIGNGATFWISFPKDVAQEGCAA